MGRHDLRSTFLISALRLVGKLLGLVKTLVIAAVFGASGALDAFWVSYMIPQLMPGLILGVVTTSFIPSFMRSARNGQENIDWKGLNTLFTLVGFMVLVIATLVVVFRGPLVTVMAPGLPDDVHALGAQLTAIMAIAVLLFGANAMLSSIMQATHRFGLMSLQSIVTNLVIIAGAILFAEELGVHGLVYAVIAGFGLHTLMLAWANRDLLRHHLRPAFDYAHQDFRAPAAHMFPLLIGFFGAVSMTIVDRIFVSTLAEGSISILVYAGMIAMLPVEVFVQAVLTAFYPGLSRDFQNSDTAAMLKSQLRGLRLLLFIMVPTTVFLVMVPGQLVSVLLERGAFSAEARELTAATLAMLALGLSFRAVNYFNFRVFHARREPWIPIGIGLFGVSINIFLDFMLIDPFGVPGIAFATSAAMMCCAVVSTIILQRRQKLSIVRPMLRPVGEILLMTVVLAAVAWSMLVWIESLQLQLDRILMLLTRLAAFIPAGLAFFAVAYLLRFEEVRTLASLVLRRRAVAGES